MRQPHRRMRYVPTAGTACFLRSHYNQRYHCQRLPGDNKLLLHITQTGHIATTLTPLSCSTSVPSAARAFSLAIRAVPTAAIFLPFILPVNRSSLVPGGLFHRCSTAPAAVLRHYRAIHIAQSVIVPYFLRQP